MSKKAYIGYDLGDGETIVDLIVIDKQLVTQAIPFQFKNVTMPDSTQCGVAIPTVYAFDDNGGFVFASKVSRFPDKYRNIQANFKRRPTDLTGEISEERKQKIISMSDNGMQISKDEFPELNNESFEQFAESVISFTNNVFCAPNFYDRIKDEISDCESVTFCVGHPTKWNDLDIAVYRAVLSQSVLGDSTFEDKPAEIVLAAESRAAFLYVKNDKNNHLVPADGSSVLLIDIGSSTIDLTVMSPDGINHLYNDGSTYLGARCIDYLIKDWFIQNLDPTMRQGYVELAKLNPTFDNGVLLNCRKAKEDIFSAGGMTSIFVHGLMPVDLDQDTVMDLIKTASVRKAVEKTANLNEREAVMIGEKSWLDCFSQFFREQKRKIDSHGLKIGKIILTGSASKMSFVKDTINDIFQAEILYDFDPARTISKGLALVGPANETSKEFQKDIRKFINEDLPKLIKDKYPLLCSRLSGIIETEVLSIVKTRVSQWRDMKFVTLDDMNNAIEADCSEININRLLENNADFIKALSQWFSSDIGEALKRKLGEICQKYGVKNMSIADLDLFRINDVNIGKVTLNPTETIVGVVSGLLAAVTGIVAGILTPIVVGTVLGIVLPLISETLFILVLEILVAAWPVGDIVIIAIGGIVAARAVLRGTSNIKRELQKKLQAYNLPHFLRNMVKDAKINKKLTEADIKGKIELSLKDNKVFESVKKSIVESLSAQIRQRADSIKFSIESR
ncbi:MAG: hypothetical protein K6G90_11080 [Clostridia bacterium]|nr:hypothetical protein [Clostridia bacterium]